MFMTNWLNATAHHVSQIHPHEASDVYANPHIKCISTLLEYQLVQSVAPNAEDAALSLVLRELNVWSYSYSLNVSTTEYRKSHLYFFPEWHAVLCSPSSSTNCPHWYVYWQVILAKVKESSGRFPKVSLTEDQACDRSSPSSSLTQSLPGSRHFSKCFEYIHFHNNSMKKVFFVISFSPMRKLRHREAK